MCYVCTRQLYPTSVAAVGLCHMTPTATVIVAGRDARPEVAVSVTAGSTTAADVIASVLKRWGVLPNAASAAEVGAACSRYILFRSDNGYAAAGADGTPMVIRGTCEVFRLVLGATVAHQLRAFGKHRFLDVDEALVGASKATGPIADDDTVKDAPRRQPSAIRTPQRTPPALAAVAVAEAGLLQAPVLPSPQAADIGSDGQAASQMLSEAETAAANMSLRGVIAAGICRDLLCNVCRLLPFDAVQTSCCGATACHRCSLKPSAFVDRLPSPSSSSPCSLLCCSVCEQEVVPELPLRDHPARNALVARLVEAYRRSDPSNAGLLANEPPSARFPSVRVVVGGVPTAPSGPALPPPDYTTALRSSAANPISPARPPSYGVPFGPGSPTVKVHRTEDPEGPYAKPGQTPPPPPPPPYAGAGMRW
jgi:hypothetical protein